MKTYMEARITTSMKKGYIYRNSYDEKNEEIAHLIEIAEVVMMLIQ